MSARIDKGEIQAERGQMAASITTSDGSCIWIVQVWSDV